ncbi:MAG: hypothetical protein H7339_09400 [Arcicella sp.]|nr:hypothetical protein [Arcicella sp.]
MKPLYETAEPNPQKLTPEEVEVFNFTLCRVKKEEHTLYEIVFVAIILAKKGYVDPSDYHIKVAIEGERQTFINLVEESLWLNKQQ